jgi:uncharacterized protein DUF6249
MKTRSLICLWALIATIPAWGQSPTVSPEPSAPSAIVAPSAAPTASVTPVFSPSATISITSDPDEDIDNAIEKKIKKHLNFTFDGDHHDASDDVPWIAIPIVFIVFLAIFGTPIMIVALIMYFSFSKSRAMHRTVRMMVEKGQPVPEALLNPPPVIRQRSDLRRGVVLLMVGTGLMVFFGACNDWEGGAWSIGIIPFLIGAGYLLVWRLDVRRGAEPLPPPPTETSLKV